ncbi:MAG: DUF3098 domain-containing protein [Ignavibacteria bacterium]|nr:DUF3098 domain-containing protein [Ignavibacteria bacterium]
MAKTLKKTSAAKTVKGESFLSPFHIYWERNNYILLVAGLILTLIGFAFLSVKPWDSTASLVIAPIILVFSFVVVFPIAIFYRPKSKKQTTEN